MKSVLYPVMLALLLSGCGDDDGSDTSSSDITIHMEESNITIDMHNQSDVNLNVSGNGLTANYDCIGALVNTVTVSGSLNNFTITNCPMQQLLVYADNTTITLVSSSFVSFEQNSSIGGNTLRAPQESLDLVDDALGVIEVPL